MKKTNQVIQDQVKFLKHEIDRKEKQAQELASIAFKFKDPSIYQFAKDILRLRQEYLDAYSAILDKLNNNE